MQMTRREFGLAVLAGMAVLLLRRIFGRVTGRGSPDAGPMRARHWKRADNLAG